MARFAVVGDGVAIDLHAVAKAEISYRGSFVVLSLFSATGFVLYETSRRFETEGSNSRRLMTNEEVEQQMRAWQMWLTLTLFPEDCHVNRRDTA